MNPLPLSGAGDDLLINELGYVKVQIDNLNKYYTNLLDKEQKLREALQRHALANQKFQYERETLPAYANLLGNGAQANGFILPSNPNLPPQIKSNNNIINNNNQINPITGNNTNYNSNNPNVSFQPNNNNTQNTNNQGNNNNSNNLGFTNNNNNSNNLGFNNVNNNLGNNNPGNNSNPGNNVATGTVNLGNINNNPTMNNNRVQVGQPNTGQPNLLNNQTSQPVVNQFQPNATIAPLVPNPLQKGNNDSNFMTNQQQIQYIKTLMEQNKKLKLELEKYKDERDHHVRNNKLGEQKQSGLSNQIDELRKANLNLQDELRDVQKQHDEFIVKKYRVLEKRVQELVEENEIL